MGMTNEEREKHIRIANMLIGAINDLIRPILMYQVEKDVTREALENYIKMLEQQPCEDAEKYGMNEQIESSSEKPNKSEIPTDWIPIKTRPMTEEEKEEIGHEYAFMYDCPLPDDGQEVLITDCYGNVEIDTFCRDHEGFYFEDNCDDGEVIAWMPKPEGYKAESEGNEEAVRCKDCYYNDGEVHAECVICDKAESEVEADDRGGN